MKYGKMVIVDNNTGERFCRDNRWRSVAPKGDRSDCLKTWVYFHWAKRQQDIIDSREPDRDPVILHLRPGDTIDELGNIVRKKEKV